MNQLQIFNFKQNDVRTILKDGEPWFVAKDVCEVFGDTNYRRSILRLDEDEKGVSPVSTPGGTQQMVLVNESGLYSLLFNMQPQKKQHITQEQYEERVKNLKEFKRWITHEVIPSVRKHGAYMTPDKIEEVLLNPDTIIKLATDLKEERQKRLAAEQKVIEQKPKVIFAEAVETSDDSILIGQLAKLITQNGVNIGQNKLFQWLRDNGFLGKKGANYNEPTQYSMDRGLFQVKERTVNNPDGSVRITRTTKVTGKGQIYFIDKFLSKEVF